jgi:two-component system sensor histidine kinase BaeS
MPAGELDALVHEMRNSLAIARANLEALVDGKMAPTLDRLNGIIQALTQLDALIDDLYKVAPGASMDAHPALINVCELLNREYASVEAIAKAKDIKVAIRRCKVPAAQCMQFYADPNRVGQITKNILLNAIRYTPEGGTVDVDCSHGGDQLEVSISDSGPGIRAEEADAVFRPGFRGAASEGRPGSGHGLAVVKKLVEEQGGTVSVGSESNGGAKFTVRLPGIPPPQSD